MIEDVIAETSGRLQTLAPRSADDVRHADRQVVGFSAEMAAADRAIKGFLYPAHVPSRPHHAHHGRRGARGLRPCSPVTAQSPTDMPAEWAQTVEAGDEAGRPRRTADFIAGMTDRYALIEHGAAF